MPDNPKWNDDSNLILMPHVKAEQQRERMRPVTRVGTCPFNGANPCTADCMMWAGHGCSFEVTMTAIRSIRI
jgi:hypothetical protein